MKVTTSSDKKNVEDKAEASSSDPSKQQQAVAKNRRYNPYDGMKPDDPNYVEIPPEEFQEMMRKKKAMGVPSLMVLKQKVNNNNDDKNDELVTKSTNIVNDTKEQVENIPPPPPFKWKKFLKMQNAGVPNEAILQLANVQGKTPTKADVLELGALLAVESFASPRTQARTTTKSKTAIITGHKSAATISTSLFPDNNANGVTTSVESRDQSNDWFTPIESKKDKQNGENEEWHEEKVAFHRGKNSPLASLVRKMVLTVDKENRNRGRRIESDSSMAGDDLLVNSKTLYQALGSFQGVQIARNNYNETLVATNQNRDAGWIRAKRQSFREIAKSIGVKLPDAKNTDANKRATIGGLDALVRYIEDRYSNEIQESLTLLQEDKLYDFDSLSAMYVPGSRVVAKNICSGGIDMICRVSWNRIMSGKTITGKISKDFEVCFEFVVAVGSNKATIVEVVEGIGEFQGRRSIFSSGGLTFVPWIAYSEDEQNTLLERYRYRGRIYNEVALNRHGNHRSGEDNGSQRSTYSYKAYRKGCFFVKRGGFGGTVNPSSASKGMATDGRIVIDAQGAYEYGNSLGVGYDPMITGIHYKLKEYKLHQSRSASKQSQSRVGSGSSGNQSSRGNKNIVDAAGNSYQSSAKKGYGKYVATNRDDNEDNSCDMVLFDSIPDDYLELVWPSVIGFSLTAKAWGDCLVDGLEDIVYSEDVFDRLVLPDDRKRLIKALVKHSSVSKAAAHHFQDLIKGKGEGTVFLLYGPPGVGKTLTAEAVAEVLQRPLYSLSMGTLGTTADDLERRLKEILTLSSRWNAIILLDEADSFLEKRSSASSLERNAMVSVMLQLVEYFTGILFLTSNRMDSLDPAFQTRITLSLPYYELAEDSRQQIWENLLHKSGVRKNSPSPLLPPIDTRELAGYPLNGREIKNSLRLALALASEEGRPIGHDLLMQTSAMVRPVSAFGESSETADQPHLKVSKQKPSAFWGFFLPALPIFILLVQNSLLVLLLFFKNGTNDDTEDTATSDRPGRRLLFK